MQHLDDAHAQAESFLCEWIERKPGCWRILIVKDVLATDRVSFDATAIWDGSRPDIPLRANDRVVVPIDRVTVSITGAIELPGEYELLRGATVSDLVNQAGGPTPYANRRRMTVRQPDVNGQYTSMPVTFEEGML